MSKERPRLATPVVYVVMEKDGTVLLTRRFNREYENGKYEVPAGHIEEDELPKAAAVREAKEEVGIFVDPSDLDFLHISYRHASDGSGHRVGIFFRARKWSGEPHICEPDKCDDLRWVNWSELPEKMPDHLRSVLQTLHNGIPYTEIRRA